MNNHQLAQRFASGATRGTGSHLFIEGDTIYSYGYHFPLARRMPWGYLVNSHGYSSSTQRHKSHVLSAIGYGRVVFVHDADEKKGEAQIKTNDDKIAYLKGRAERATTRREMYEREIRELEQQNALIAAHLLNGVSS